MSDYYERGVTTKNGAYGNFASIDVYDDGECDLCHKPGRVMLFDTSGCEYAELQACISCLNKEYAKGCEYNDAINNPTKPKEPKMSKDIIELAEQLKEAAENGSVKSVIVISSAGAGAPLNIAMVDTHMSDIALAGNILNDQATGMFKEQVRSLQVRAEVERQLIHEQAQRDAQKEAETETKQ